MRSKAKDSCVWFSCAVIMVYGIVTATSASAQVTFSWATVGNPGNVADTNGDGSVDYAYQISKYDVTNSQYVQFLDAVDPTGGNSLGLYTTGQTTNAMEGVAFNSAAADGSKYTVETGKENQPVVFVSWTDSARFVNWLSNGQGSGSTESGVYDMTQAYPTRAAGATIFIPNNDEWYKAAYYDPTLNHGTGGYWQYATRGNTVPSGDVPPGGSNSANWFGTNGYAVTQSMNDDPNQDYLTDVGAYSDSMSYYNTFDQSGDVYEWTETLEPATKFGGSRRAQWGGSWNSVSAYLLGSGGFGTELPDDAESWEGFRVAMVPEPTSFAVAGLALCGLLVRRRRAGRR